MIERPLKAYPVDPKTQEGPAVLLKVEAADGIIWIPGRGFVYYDDDAGYDRLMFETGGRLVRPRAFAFPEETI